MRTGVRVAVVLFSAAVLQRGLFSQIRIMGVSADVLLLVAIAAGMTGGPDRGAVVGFFAGLTLDLLVQTPLGMAALTYCITGYVVGRMQRSVRRSAWWFSVIIAAGGSALAMVLFAVLGEMLGQGGMVTERLGAVVLVVSLTNALLSPLALKIMRAVWRESEMRLAVR